MPRYSLSQQTRVQSPQEGRGTGLRHGGGGDMSGKGGPMGKSAPMGGYMQSPEGGLAIAGQSLQPGSMYRQGAPTTSLTTGPAAGNPAGGKMSGPMGGGKGG